MSLRQFCHGSTGRSCSLMCAVVLAALVSAPARAVPPLSPASPPQGIFVVLGLPISGDPGSAVELARSSDVRVYFQSPDAKEVAAVRQAALEQKLLGQRVFVVQADWQSIHLADNLADFAIASAAVGSGIDERELLRVLRPQAKAVLPDGKIIEKPLPEGTDEWSHPYHGPDNNPQSTDQLAKAPYLTQFLAAPEFSPMPEVTVAAGGRIFKAMGHIAHKANQNPWLNTLLGINAYNGTILWKRPLKEGFMIHRNTMIATPDYLYLADDESCREARGGHGRGGRRDPSAGGPGRRPRVEVDGSAGRRAVRSGGRPRGPDFHAAVRQLPAWGIGRGACGKVTTTRTRKRVLVSAARWSPSTRKRRRSSGAIAPTSSSTAAACA